MSVIDGLTLRTVRIRHGVSLREFARAANVSSSHLSKLEYGEAGRPVAPEIVAAYERATGTRLTDTKLGTGQRWPERLDPRTRWVRHARLIAVWVGGAVERPVPRLLDRAGRLPQPVADERLGRQLVELTDWLCDRDGGLAGQVARLLLRWLVDQTTVPPAAPLVAATCRLALRAACTATAAGAHRAAQTLQEVALHTAVAADQPDLAGRVLVDIAEQHDQLGHHADCATLARVGEPDVRIGDRTRQRLHGLTRRATDLNGSNEPSPPEQALPDPAHARPSIEDQR